MSRMVKLYGSCPIIALQHASGLEESQVIDICKWHGFEWGEGMYIEDIHRAAREIGIKKRSIKIEPCTLRAFLKAYPMGLYLVCSYDHIFAVINGGVINHPRQSPPSNRAKIVQAWRVSK